jgi:FixJ family two-component response regulator
MDAIPPFGHLGPAPLIAVVEDDSAVRHSIEFTLEAEGYDVCAFERAGEALSSVRLGEAACLVIDYALPDIDGVALLNTLRRRGNTCPAVIIAGSPSLRCRHDAEAAGAPLIEKPLMGDELSRKIAQVMAADRAS